MDESNVTCDAVISAVKSLLTSTQFSVFREDPKVGVHFVCIIHLLNFRRVQISS